MAHLRVTPLSCFSFLFFLIFPGSCFSLEKKFLLFSVVLYLFQKKSFIAASVSGFNF